jgi:hypothetical protein
VGEEQRDRVAGADDARVERGARDAEPPVEVSEQDALEARAIGDEDDELMPERDLVRLDARPPDAAPPERRQAAAALAG